MRAEKGTVKVEGADGRLRLRWSVAGKRYNLAIGLPDTKLNRRAAEKKAIEIELDIVSGNFDLTLAKYSSRVKPKQDSSKMSCVELFQAFTDYKAASVSRMTLYRYQRIVKLLETHLYNLPANSLNSHDADLFIKICNDKPVMRKVRLVLLKAGWEWGIKRGSILVNPWVELVTQVKVPPKQPPRPFTRDEIAAIILGFREHRRYNYYADFVEFLFGTGCRTSEAIGLRWQHVSDNCGSVWIGESLTRGVRKSTKTNRARVVTLTAQLQSMLTARRPEKPDPDALVFHGPRGCHLSDIAFRSRAWVKILSDLGIEYRKPYCTRHSLISHALDMGMSPLTVAQLTGHDVQTLYQNYAGSVVSKPRLPDLGINYLNPLVE